MVLLLVDFTGELLTEHTQVNARPIAHAMVVLLKHKVVPYYDLG